jgi:hypothetical protein
MLSSERPGLFAWNVICATSPELVLIPLGMPPMNVMVPAVLSYVGASIQSPMIEEFCRGAFYGTLAILGIGGGARVPPKPGE